jgi:hypothetical protein
MRTILLLILCAFAPLREAIATPPPPVVAATARIALAWAPSPTPGITRYRLYHSTNDVTWHTNWLVTGTNYTATVTAGSTNWFTITAVNADGIESDRSNVFEKPIEPKPQPAGNLIAVPIVTEVQTRSGSNTWAVVRRYTNNIVVGQEPGREFRARLDIGTPIQLVQLP